MKLVFCLGLAVAASVGVFAANLPVDLTAVQGSWTPARVELAGRPMTDDFLNSIRLNLDNGKHEVFVGALPDNRTYTIDSKTRPKSMTVTGPVGPSQGKTFPAIYEIQGGTLRICYGLSGAKRLTEFKTSAGTKLHLVTYNRKKE